MATETPSEKLSQTAQTGLIVRSARPEDAPATLALYRSILAEGRYTVLEPDELDRDEAAERQEILEERSRPGCLRLVAELDGVIVGMARVRADDLKRTAHFGLVDSVWVQADMRGRGIGRALMQTLIRWAEDNPHLEKLGLFVFSTSEAAIRLYVAMGFRIEGRAPRDIKFGEGDYADTVLMGRMVDGTHPA